MGRSVIDLRSHGSDRGLAIRGQRSTPPDHQAHPIAKRISRRSPAHARIQNHRFQVTFAGYLGALCVKSIKIMQKLD
ncbi:MAG: hypothetical protein EA001_07300 [Oscillatoriales cyanobacterium]|nr:MAG: hypothetical protein EA001_07300 [Oscillatoriales cyanobacterium]